MANTAASTAILDFTNVKDSAGFNKKRVPSGDYLAKVVKVEDAESKRDKGAQWLFSIKFVNKYTDRTFPYYCKLEANQLWKIRNIFLAAGIVIPKKKVKLDPAKIVGKLIAVTVEDDEYEGKEQSVIVQTFPPSDLDEDVNTGTDSDDEEEELDDEDTDEDEDDVTDAVGDDEDDEEEDEEPAPPARKKAAIPAQRKTSPAKKKAASVSDVDDDELEELDLESI